MMIPEPWQNHESMDPDLRAFHGLSLSLMEPWDGPASIASPTARSSARVRSQRPASFLLLRQRRCGDGGVEVGARHSRRRHRAAVSARIRPSSSSIRCGPHRVRRRSEASWRGAALYRDGLHPSTSTISIRRRTSAPSHLEGDAASAVVWLHARGTAALLCADGHQRRRSDWSMAPTLCSSDKPNKLRCYDRHSSRRCSRRSPTPLPTRFRRNVTRRSRRLVRKATVVDPRPESPADLHQHPVIDNDQLREVAPRPRFRAIRVRRCCSTRRRMAGPRTRGVRSEAARQ